MPLTHLFLAFLFLQTPKPGSVSGTVTNAATGGPVRKAHVILRSGETNYAATTDAEGHFAVAEVKPGTFTGHAECAGFEMSQPEPVRVAEDQHVESVTFSLTPHGVITGKVLDDDGRPMAQISVQAQIEVFGRTGRTLSARNAALTDDRGVYRFFDLPAGRYLVAAINPALAGSPNGRVHTDPVETEYVMSWFPGVTEASQAAANQLAPGAELGGIDIHMHKVRVFHVRGKAVAPGSQQRLDAAVMLAPCDNTGGQGYYAPVLRDGSFDAIDIMPGVWCAVVNVVTDNNHGFYARQAVTVSDRDVDNVVLTVTPTVELRGQVLVDGDTPAKLPQAPVQFEPLENPGRGVGAGIRPDGGFTIANVPPGPYRVNFNLPGMYLKAVRFNGQDVADGRIQVPPAGGQLTLLMATDGGEISGSVQGTGLVVTAVSSGGPLINGVTPSGNFVIRNLAPGDYQVLVWETRDTGLLQYAEFRKQFDSRAVSVTVHPKGRESVSVTAIPAAEIEAAKARLR